MLKLFKWLDTHLLSIFAGFLLAFIPLYPKLPLFDILPGYIVRVRLEDILVLTCFALWLIYLLRKKITLSENPLIKPISIYLAIGLLSLISAVFLIKTIPLETIHIQKGLLHLFRRIEYFSLFFIFYTSIRSIKQIKIYLLILVFTVVAVSLYGFGQRYLYWPAYSTMNREFAKGWQLYLTEHARVLSTFGGHYDLAAFMMMALVFLWSLFFGIKKLLYRLFLLIVLAFSFWTLILTASRTSFIAYLFGLLVMFFFWTFKKGIFWSASRFLVVSLLSVVLMLSFGDLSERFTKLLRIDQRLSSIKTLLMSPFGAPPKDKAMFLINNPDSLADITSKSDAPPKVGRPSDVYTDVDLLIPKGGTISAVKRTYSQTAFRYDLSTAIRFDALWPQAIAGFKKNVLLGSGYSTLNKAQTHVFTEAESTDNDFLRALGETGLLGFAAFYGTLLFILYYVWKNLSLYKDPLLFSFTAGFAGLLVGLLVNAVYIDVFESSKVAFSFWSLTGITLAGIKLLKKDESQPVALPVIPGLFHAQGRIKVGLTGFFRSDKFFLSLIVLIAFLLRLYRINTPLADWHSWRQADTASVTRNYVKNGVNLLYPIFDDLSNVASGKDNPKGLRFVEFPLFNLAHVFVDQLIDGYNLELKGRLTSILASLFSTIFIYLLVRKYNGSLAAIFSALFFAIIPFNIFFSRVILPEPFLVASTTGMIYFFDRYLNNKKILSKWINLILALIFSAGALLIKPYAAFLFLPVIYLWLRYKGLNLKSIFSIIFLLLVVSLPFVWWRWWISHFPEGIPANLWLLNGDGIRFKGAFFFWIFADRLGRMILGFYGLPLLIFGILAKKGREGFLYHFWGLSILLYVTVFATGNVRHDYYQTFCLPIIAIYLGKGAVALIEYGENRMGKLKSLFILVVLVLFMEMFGWYYIRDFYNINHPEIVEAGHAVELKTRNNSLVIAPYNGDTAFLYQTRRAGWPIMEKSIDDMIKLGAHYYVSVNFDDLTNQLIINAREQDLEKRKYKLIDLTSNYAIIQLVPDKKLPN